ncbi:MAG: hypothetical protein ABI591_02005 [Kofleriaceae bacterium]
MLLGVPAFVNSVTSGTACTFTLDELVYDAAGAITVDLAKNTSLPPNLWATGVDVDKQTNGGWTTIGPKFNSGNHVGAAYVTPAILQRYKGVLASWPPAPDAVYQYQAVLRGDTSGETARFHGCKVEVISAAVGSLIKVATIPVGMSTPVGNGTWIDLADASLWDPKSNGFTTIDATSPVGSVGAVFVSVIAMEPGFPASIPKIPRGLGW